MDTSEQIDLNAGWDKLKEIQILILDHFPELYTHHDGCIVDMSVRIVAILRGMEKTINPDSIQFMLTNVERLMTLFSKHEWFLKQPLCSKISRAMRMISAMATLMRE